MVLAMALEGSMALASYRVSSPATTNSRPEVTFRVSKLGPGPQEVEGLCVV